MPQDKEGVLKLNQPKYYWIIASVLLVIMFLIAFFSSRGAFGDPGDSGTVDEVAHIPSGYSYDKYLDFRLNPEHPPLAKAVAGLPLALSRNINGLEKDWSWSGINQWESGWYFIYEAGNDPAKVLLYSRIPIMLLMIALGLFVFLWAKRLFGPKIGLLVLVLYTFYPDVLAHGRLVTTDIAAALGFVITIYFFDKAITEGSKKKTLFAAVAFGIAQLLKFSSFLLFGILLFLIIIRAIMERKEGFGKKLWQYFKVYFWVCAISLVVVWIVYLPFVWRTPIEIEHKVIEMNLAPNDPRTLPVRNFLHYFENNPYLRAIGHYLLGIALVVGRVEGGNKTFIMGQLSDKSISWYFPVAWLLKTAIPIIVFVFWSLIAIITKWPKEEKQKWILALILTPIIVYWAFTLKGSLNIGIRHLMPTVPFVLLLIGCNLYYIFNQKGITVQKILSYALVLYLVISTLANYPNFIAYFNEATPKDKRYERLMDSSLDWGQDLLRLKKYVDENKIESIKIDYFGGSVPSYYMPEAVEWHSSYGPTTGWLAVSATFYQSSKLVGEMEGKWSYGWLDKMKPKIIIGGSILVFNITEQNIQSAPPTSPYPIKKIDLPTINNFERKAGL